MYQKDFEGWHKIKPDIDRDRTPPTYSNQEIWWCSIGVNIGYEMDGKNELYNRPVLVVRKFNQSLFWGLPLSTKIKQNPYYHPVTFKNDQVCVILSQLKSFDSKRLRQKMGKLTDPQFKRIRELLRDMI